MNSSLTFGLFALYVVVVSLVRCLAGEEFHRLTAMKRLWGRRRGLLIHFLSNVALPTVLGIVFLTQGIVALRLPEPDLPSRLHSHHPLAPLAASAQGYPDSGPEVAGSRFPPTGVSPHDLSQQIQWLVHLP